MNQEIRGIICDLDGTLLNQKKEITPLTRHALIQAQQKGLKLILASSRGYFMIEEFVKLLEMDKYGGYVICHNGISAYNCQNHQEFVIENRGFSNEVALRLFEYGKKHRHLLVFESSYGMQLLIPIGLRWVSPYLTYLRFKKKYKEMRKLTFQLFGEFRFSPDQKLEVVRSVDELALPVSKAGYIRVRKNVDEMIDIMNQVFGDDVDFVRISRFWCDVMPKGVSKASGFKLIEKELNFSLDQCIAFGDSNNDLEMIQRAKLGIAMGNALDIIKTCSDDITLTNDQDGIVAALIKYGLL